MVDEKSRYTASLKIYAMPYRYRGKNLIPRYTVYYFKHWSLLYQGCCFDKVGWGMEYGHRLDSTGCQTQLARRYIGQPVDYILSLFPICNSSPRYSKPRGVL